MCRSLVAKARDGGISADAYQAGVVRSRLLCGFSSVCVVRGKAGCVIYCRLVERAVARLCGGADLGRD